MSAQSEGNYAERFSITGFTFLAMPPDSCGARAPTSLDFKSDEYYTFVFNKVSTKFAVLFKSNLVSQNSLASQNSANGDALI